jgi:hypothetical protein
VAVVVAKAYSAVSSITHHALSIVESPLQPVVRIPLSPANVELDKMHERSTVLLVYSNEYETQLPSASVPLFLPFLAQSTAHAASASTGVASYTAADWVVSPQVACKIGLTVLANLSALDMPSNTYTFILLLKLE